MSAHINGTERTGRTKVLTRPTTDTFFYIYYRNLWRICFFRIGSYHLYGTCRTMAGTVATFHSICQRYTVLFNPYGMSDLNSWFLGKTGEMNSTGRTNFRTFSTFGTAISTFVWYFRSNYCRSPTMYIFRIYWPLSWEKHAVYAFFMIQYPGGIFLRLYGAVASYIRCSSTSNVIMTVKSI